MKSQKQIQDRLQKYYNYLEDDQQYEAQIKELEWVLEDDPSRTYTPHQKTLIEELDREIKRYEELPDYLKMYRNKK